MRTTTRYQIMALVVIGILTNSGDAVFGQNLLNRLENRIRQRFGNEETPPASSEPAAVSTNAPGPAVDTVDQRPVTLGLEAEERGVQPPYEIIVIAVRPGTAAKAAGLKAGDALTTADGKPVGTIEDLAKVVRVKTWGDSLRLGYVRQGIPAETTVNFLAPGANPAVQVQPPRAIGEQNQAGANPAIPPLRMENLQPLPAMQPSTAQPPTASPVVERPEPGSGRIGVTVENVATSPPGPGVPVKRGAVVVQVDPNSPAGQAGIKQGDVIVAIDGVIIRDAAALIEEVSKTTPGQRIELGLYQGETLAKLPLVLTDPAKLGSSPEAPMPETNSQGGGLFGALGGLLGGNRSARPVVPAQPTDPPALAQPPAMLPNTGNAGGAPPAIPLPTSPASEPELPNATPRPSTVAPEAEVKQLRSEIELLREQLESLQKRLQEIEKQPN